MPRKRETTRTSFLFLAQRVVFFILILLHFMVVIPGVFAQDNYGLESTAEDVLGPHATGPSTVVIVGWILQGALTLVGVIFLVLFVYAGFRWMTAKGNSEDVEKSKKIMINATIGLIVVLAAYATTKFTVDAIIASTAK